MQLIEPENWSNENLNPRIPTGAAGLRLMSAPENMPIPVIEVFLKG